jgi:tetratricopeptide (TPR) repeat protein
LAEITKLIDAGKLDEASARLKSASQRAPNDPKVRDTTSRLADAFAHRTLLLTNEGQLTGAGVELRKALDLDPANAKAKSVSPQLAQALADRAAKLREENVDRRTGRWRDEGKLKEAQDAVLSALQLDPNNAAAAKLAKRLAQDDALRAANYLDEGKEADARASLEAARALDPRNELANTLYDSITANPEQAFGAKSFPYTIKPGDTLSKISEIYLKEEFKFYLLARYNGIAVPRGLKAGQVIKVPGTKPHVAEQPQSSAKKQPTPSTAGPPPPSEPVGDRAKQIEVLDRKARDCYRRQDLDCCIASWNQVLLLDPLNETAKRERDRCVRLQEALLRGVN